MGLALRKEDYDDLFAAPPAVDWAAAFAAVEDLNDLRWIADRIEADTRTWLAGMSERLQTGLADIERKIEGLPRDDVRKVMLPLLDEAITAASSTVEAHAEPFHERDDAKETFGKLRKVSGPAGKFLRKQINRIEDARVQRHNGALDLYYALLAFRSELEEDGSGGQSFDDPSRLGDFLRKQVA